MSNKKFTKNISDEINKDTTHHLLTQIEDQIEQIFENCTIGTFAITNKGDCVSINNQALKWLGCSREDFLTENFRREAIPNKNWQILSKNIANLIESNLSEKEVELTSPLGKPSWFRIYIRPPRTNKQDALFRVIFYDISIEKNKRVREHIASIAFESRMGICVANENGLILEINNSFSLLSGYNAREVRGREFHFFFDDAENAQKLRQIKEALNSHGLWEGEIRCAKKNQEKFVAWLNISAVPMTEKVIKYFVICIYDITQNKIIQDEINNLAFIDPLTQLPNRRKLSERLKRILSIAPRSHLHGAILFIDLNDFKSINDTKGHSTGDLMLVEVAHRLSQSVRDGDMVARIGGDEFVVLLSELSSNEDEACYQANTIGKKINELLNVPFRFDDFSFNSGGSIGVSIFSGEDSADDIFQQADMAMYQAKKEGKGALCFYDPVMKKAATEFLLFEQELRGAIESDELKLYYQPQFNYRQEIFGVEALLRWQHPKRGLVMPDSFISLAEKSGLILPIGYWILEKACDQIKQWQSNLRLSKLQISINVSARQFADEDFTEKVAQIIHVSGIDPSRLKIELTESMMHNLESIKPKMEKLRMLGIKFSLDDFGTGYSSLSSLIKLPLDQLKIDKSFVNNMLSNSADTIIIKTIISMAKNLGVEVIAEGLETEKEKDFLNSLGCNLYQGFLLSPALPRIQFEELMFSPSFKNSRH